MCKQYLKIGGYRYMSCAKRGLWVSKRESGSFSASTKLFLKGGSLSTGLGSG